MKQARTITKAAQQSVHRAAEPSRQSDEKGLFVLYFELSILIHRSPAAVFAFLRDKDLFTQEKNSPVLLLKKTTHGPPGVGTRYREVVQMLPFIRGEILSVITSYEPHDILEESFQGPGMTGHLAYQFLSEGAGTRLIQRETLNLQGISRLFKPIIAHIFPRRLEGRLEDIKRILENGWNAIV
jgi:hypothetical protein